MSDQSAGPSLRFPAAPDSADDVPPVQSRGHRSPGAVLADISQQCRAAFEREMDAGRGFLWLPVFFGIGILIYFALPREPSAVALCATAIVLAATAWRLRRRVDLFRLILPVAMIAAGATTIKLRTDAITAPTLEREMTVTVTGWVAAVEAAARGGVRVLVDVDDIAELSPETTPRRVRITVRARSASLKVGDAVSARARLTPPSGPVIPGGYDFARAAFYQGIGAVGFSYGAPQPAELGSTPLGIRLGEPIARLRAQIRDRITEALPGDNGAIAAALIMGDRGGISEEAQEAMRASGLGHVLAISGLHMALVAGVAFWLIRAFLALWPNLALSRPIKQWAAIGALVVAGFYLAISGAGVATQRAFVMLAIMLVAILLNRRAITLRNVAFAAFVVLLIAPESLLSVSFQMSFAATLALVAGYEAFTDRADRRLSRINRADGGSPSKLWRWVSGLFLTSLIAGLATAPFAAFHFQRVAPLTLIANLAAMPVVGLVVMPMALVSVVAMPFGLESVPLAIMSIGIDWVLVVAKSVADWSSGLGAVRMTPIAALLLAAAGFLWLTLWRERWRLAGIVPILLAVPIALSARVPDVLVDADGELVAVRGDDRRLHFIGVKGHSFAIDNWLRADGEAPNLDRDLESGTRCDPLGCVAELENSGSPVAVATRPAAFADDCAIAAVVVTRLTLPDRCALTATVVDHPVLAAGGAQALFRRPDSEGEGADLKPKFEIVAAYPPARRPFMPPIGVRGR